MNQSAPLRLVASRDTPPSRPEPLQGLRIVERGWLSSNNVLIHGREPGDGAVLVDSSHCLHAEQTVALLHRALDEEPLRCVLNTHLHSDHCGGNAAVQAAFGAPSFIPARPWEAVQAWDVHRLGFAGVGQHCERFTAQGTLVDGERLNLGGRAWQVVAAPGHDPDAVMLFDTDHGVLISGDALWQDGFGIVFPELDGVAAFDDVAEVLDLIETLPVSWVIPGHGSAFEDVGASLARARSRLAAYRAAPLRHARHAAKVLVKYHMMEEQVESLVAFHLWAGSATLLRRIWQGQGCPEASLHAWCNQLLAELTAVGALKMDQGQVHDA